MIDRQLPGLGGIDTITDLDDRAVRDVDIEHLAPTTRHAHTWPCFGLALHGVGRNRTLKRHGCSAAGGRHEPLVIGHEYRLVCGHRGELRLEPRRQIDDSMLLAAEARPDQLGLGQHYRSAVGADEQLARLVGDQDRRDRLYRFVTREVASRQTPQLRKLRVEDSCAVRSGLDDRPCRNARC